MISEQWVTEIISRFPYFSNRTEDEKSALRQDLVDFASGKGQGILIEILNEFKATEFKKAPGMWWFYQRSGGNGADEKPSWRECECGQLYVHKGSKCPVCGSYNFIMHTGSAIPTEAIEITESCSVCSWYNSGDDKRLYGPTCNEYGTYNSGKAQICKDCKCYDCCQLSYLIKTNPTLYRERYGDIVDKQFSKVFSKLLDKMSGKE